MASYNVELNYFNGSSYDILIPKINNISFFYSGTYTGNGSDRTSASFPSNKMNPVLFGIVDFNEQHDMTISVTNNSSSQQNISRVLVYDYSLHAIIISYYISASKSNIFFYVTGANNIDGTSIALSSNQKINWGYNRKDIQYNWFTIGERL